MRFSTITALDPIPRRKKWRMCVFDSGESAAVPAELVILQSLYIGKRISEEEFKKLASEAELTNGKEAAFRLLAVRSHSEFEMKCKLRQRGIKATIIQAVINDLKRLEFINDEAFAAAFVQNLLQRKPSGKLLIKAELRKNGIQESVIDRVIEKVFSEKNLIEMAESAARKWLASHSTRSEKEQAMRLGRYLYQRGFSWDVIEEVIGANSEFSGSEE